MSLMMNGPKPGDESYENYVSEKEEILASLRRRAHMMTVSALLRQRGCEHHESDLDGSEHGDSRQCGLEERHMCGPRDHGVLTSFAVCRMHSTPSRA